MGYDSLKKILSDLDHVEIVIIQQTFCTIKQMILTKYYEIPITNERNKMLIKVCRTEENYK